MTSLADALDLDQANLTDDPETFAPTDADAAWLASQNESGWVEDDEDELELGTLSATQWGALYLDPAPGIAEVRGRMDAGLPLF